MSCRFLASFVIPLALWISATETFAWGERGHDLIARAAARLVIERGGAKVAKPFVDKEHLLGHLANVPDTVWRSLGRAVEEQNGPTHYLDVEFVSLTPSFATLPKSSREMLESMRKLCATAPKGYVCSSSKAESIDISQAGTAPLRAVQLFEQMKRGFARAKASSKDLNAGVDEAILAAGLLAHFIGDLGNPLHTTRDYDGFERGQGGVHSYFESAAVNALDLRFDADVMTAARQGKSLHRLTDDVPSAVRPTFGQDALSVTHALLLDSFSRLQTVFDLDRKLAVTKPSSEERGLKIRAERQPVAKTAAGFRDLLVERMSTAADALAHLWLLAWRQAGSPDLSTYASWEYPTAPAFIPPDYLPSP